MHELSLAVNIVEIAEENAQSAGVQKFDEIVLEIGTLSGVVIEALEMAMDSAFKNSVLEHAVLNVKMNFLQKIFSHLAPNAPIHFPESFRERNSK